MARKYKVVAKYEFEMVGTSAQRVLENLDVLMDALVECHSNEQTCGEVGDFEEFTGKYPKRISAKATLIREK